MGMDRLVGRRLKAFAPRDKRWQKRHVSSIGVSSVINTGKPPMFFGDFFNESLAKMCAQATLPRILREKMYFGLKKSASK